MPKNNGLTTPDIWWLATNCDYIYAGTAGGVFRAKISDFGFSKFDYEKNYPSVTIFPNPIQNNFFIIKNNSNSANITILNQIGENVYSSLMRTEVSYLFVQFENFSSGTYFLCITYSNGKIVVVKFFKVKLTTYYFNFFGKKKFKTNMFKL
ncbi:MAG: T9SS type A sorting domain-containing protein [Ignavibacteria bacterium]|nr:T9SS type A sorting domain-containing protein [Ignavibacteria bacterium]